MQKLLSNYLAKIQHQNTLRSFVQIIEQFRVSANLLKSFSEMQLVFRLCINFSLVEKDYLTDFVFWEKSVVI